MELPLDKTVKDLLLRHLLLIRAPIPILVADHLDTVHVLNRSANLLVDLLRWRNAEDYPVQLIAQLEELQKQPHAPAQTLQQQLASLVIEAIPK